MKPPPFRYCRPESVDEAVEVLAEHGDDAKPLAGGQSLLPMMNFRLARPSVLIDLERIPDLDAISIDRDGLSLGAMARQAQVAVSPLAIDRMPLLVEGLRHVGHHQIRTRGTIGGSLAHGDPAAELPAIAVVLDADIEARGPGGTRTLPASSFWLAPFTTALADDEILTSVRFPTQHVEAWSFHEIARRGGDFAIAGVAAVRVSGRSRMVAFGLGWVPLRLTAAEAAWHAGDGGDEAIEAAAAAASGEADPADDAHADASYRREALAAVVRRTLRDLTR
jgi:CO/xanthine dehydrogenase FAD-binding subunit